MYNQFAIGVYVLITFLAIQYLRLKHLLSTIEKNNNPDNNTEDTFYQIKIRPAIENVGFRQPKILFLSSKYYDIHNLNSIPYSYSRRKFANLDFIKIPSNMSRIEKYFQNNFRKFQEKNIYLNNHNYTEIILSLENDLLFQIISKKGFQENINNLKYFFNSRHISQKHYPIKFTIIHNFIDISQEIPFPFDYYYLHQRDKFIKLIQLL